MTEQVLLNCTDTGKSVKVNLVSVTKELLRVFIPGSDTVLNMPWKTNQYVGNKAGLEFTSNGKVVR